MSISSDDKYGPLGAAQAVLALSVGGYGTIGIQISGTWAGTITFEGSVDAGTWVPIRATPPNSSTQVTTTTANGLWLGSVAGLRVVRARMSAYTSGTADVQFLVAGVGGGSSGGGGGSGSDVNLIEVGGASISLGQAAMAASLPVVIASNQSAVDVNIVGGGGSGGTASDFGDPFPTAGTATGVEGPSGDMESLALEQFDYDSGAGTQAQTALGLVIPASGGPVPVGSANPLPMSAASLPLPTGAATAANQQTDALTDTELRATPVPVSGTVSTGGLTDAELRATPVPVSGTVTANAGTNLNTSALALEAGGNLAAAATSLATLDNIVSGAGANISQINGVTPLMGAGATGTGSPRVTQANDAGKTLLSAGGSAASNGNNTLIAAHASLKRKVYAFSLTTVSTTAVTCIFQDGASGTELWRVVLQAITGASTGANLAISPPASLFATSAATLLNLNLSSANAVHWSASYFDEA